MDTSPQHKRPIWLGVLAAALAPWLFVVCWALVAASGADTAADFLALAALTFVLAVPISLAAMLVAGLPYVLWLRSRGWLTWLSICSGAAAIGALALACFTFLDASAQQAPDFMAYSLGAGFGLASGVAFCTGTGLTIHSSRTRFAGRLNSGVRAHDRSG